MKVSNLNDTSDSYPGTGIVDSPQSVARGVSRIEAREAELGLFKEGPVCSFVLRQVRQRQRQVERVVVSQRSAPADNIEQPIVGEEWRCGCCIWHAVCII